MTHIDFKILASLPCERSRRDFVAKRFERVTMEGITAEEIAADTDHFNFHDLNYLCDGLAGKLKQVLMKEFWRKECSIEENNNRMIEALRSGAVKITREMYDAIRPMYYYSVTAEERKQLEEYAENLKKQV